MSQLPYQYPDPVSNVAEGLGLDPTKLQDGPYLAGVLKEGLGVDGTRPTSIPGVDRILGSLIDKAGAGYNSPDLVERAESRRIFGLVIDTMHDKGDASPKSPQEEFLGTSLAPEELTSSMASIAANIEGKNGDFIRQKYDIQSPLVENPKYQGKEALIAAGLVTFGMEAARSATEKDKLLKPKAVYNDKTTQAALEIIGSNPAFANPGEAAQLLHTVQNEVLGDMAAAFKEQHRARNKAAAQAARL